MQLTAITVANADGNSRLLIGDQVLGLISVLQSPKLGVEHKEGQRAILTASASQDSLTRVTIDMLDGLEVDASAQEVLYRDHCNSIGRNFSLAGLGTNSCPDMIDHVRQQLVAMSDNMAGSSLFLELVGLPEHHGGNYRG